jgi:1-acyl-sn-glycerol-3-phosphate acyltransferase
MASSIPFKIMNLYSTLWIRAKARVVVRGLEELPQRAKGEKRVYLLLNRSTTFDVVALMHVSKEPFAILMEKGSVAFPVLRRVIRGASLIHFDGSESAVESCVETVDAGKPLLVSLRGEDYSEADAGKLRVEGIRIAHATGAKLYPVFLKVEDERIRRLRLKGADGTERPYTAFKDSLYFIEILKPIDLSSLPSEPSREEYLEIAESLYEKAEEVEARYDAFLADNRERFASLRRRGGSRLRVAW